MQLLERLGAEDLRDSLPDNPEGYQFKTRDVSGIQGVVFHQSLSWATIEQIHAYHSGPNHMATQGLQRISYTIGIRRNGRIALLNDIETKPWSQGYKDRPGDENAEFLSVMFEGLFSWEESGQLVREHLGQQTGEPTPEQLSSALFTWDTIAKEFNFGTDALYGHYHFGKPACPGKSLKSLINTVREQYRLSEVEELQRFLEDYEFNSILALQQSYNKLTGAGIFEDDLWGGQSAKAACWFIQQRKP